MNKNTKREIGSWIVLLIGVVVFVVPIMLWLNHAVLKPVVERPEAEWVPVVNPKKVPSGYVPSVYRAEFEMARCAC